MTSPSAPALPQNILSIQSWVSYGHVGNAAALFPLQRLGFEVWTINTVQFSNHTGYGEWTGSVFPPELVADLLDGIEARGVLSECAAVLSGYMGSEGTVSAVVEAVRRVRAANPAALYCCDPVMGDVGRGVFVRPELPDLIRAQAVPEADIVTPNQFELELLTGRRVTTLQEALDAARMLRGTLREGGPRIVVVTSLVREDAPEGVIETLAVTGEGAWLCRTPLLPLDPPRNGTGDAIAALFLGHYLKTGDAGTALSLSMSALFAVLDRTHRAGTREIQLVAAQDEYARPSRVFGAERVA
ncbi:pyridoxal kinase PdxY [Deinococcus metallilatus]|uniref:Pyridoxal kinase PdxY n=1 Tax=Deinococcus metallilatus TaxID=1211322 RepID=A0AAJ5F0M3_9DEIO|nr:pyridoxal kinase PdxY [Deinococcus metallilatus]MBB5297143.1 pyridoxine kinase [Deinococcus metallilatus]QBY10071.1 pyridoxal kinase PdxY [Deinococcus metallilatus]RXJ08326.1 pyridoxal kinase PdxY [Deinococcus metallilatus]TLK21964.1 pyridoxal kinase PdxY [Deinococcus metallilatus]GMA17292.1 pyridoxal kinase PdxY [Deinococcus metallilatus]